MYQSDLLSSSERSELEAMVSLKTGRPIDRTTPSDPSGFGLGVAQRYTTDYGRVWFYEGETLGYRLFSDSLLHRPSQSSGGGDGRNRNTVRILQARRYFLHAELRFWKLGTMQSDGVGNRR